jgi:hypothetical protein
MKRPRSSATTPGKSARTPGSKTTAAASNHADAVTACAPIRSDTDDVRAPEIDYKSPRKNGRWAKGQSGNKRGRKKGSKNKKTVIIEMMEAKLGRTIPDPKKLTRYEAMMFKAIQKALGGDIRSMGFVLSEYRKALESSGSLNAAATPEEDQQAYNALCAKIRREIEDEVRREIRDELLRELRK